MAERYSILPGDPRVMGAVVRGDGVNFSFSAPHRKEAVLTVFRNEAILCSASITDEMRTGDVCSVFVRGAKAGDAYEITVGGEMVSDPFARAFRNGACVVAREAFDWKGDARPAIPFSEMMIYKLHVRGFTKHARSGVRDKGTFAGVMHKIPYFQELGINTVELMPVYSWDDTLKIPVLLKPETFETHKNFWGYAKKNYYFAPRADFAASDDAVREMKTLIRSLHAAGIACILEFFVPYGTNAHELLLAVRYWRIVYHVDGFHFLGDGVPRQMLLEEPMLADSALFFDYIDPHAVYGTYLPEERHLAEYNTNFQRCLRHLLKGDGGSAHPASDAMRRNPPTHGVVNYMANVDGFTLMDSVSYNDKHNEDNGENNTDGSNENISWNCGIEGATRKKDIVALRKQQVKNALSYVFLSQGIPLLYAGDEFGNSQGGNNNAYASDNPTGWVDWSCAKRNADITEFVKTLIAFRKHHPILHPEKELRGMDYRGTGFPDISFHDRMAWINPFEENGCAIAALYCGAYATRKSGECDDYLYVAFNGGYENHVFALPDLPKGFAWGCALATGGEPVPFTEDEEDEEDEPRQISVPGRSVTVLVGQEADA